VPGHASANLPVPDRHKYHRNHARHSGTAAVWVPASLRLGRHGRDDGVVKNRLAAFVVMLLTMAAVAGVALALRPKPAPGAPPAPPDLGAIAAVGDHVWRWSGRGDCSAGQAGVPLLVSVAGGPWTASPVPLVTVSRLTFTSDSVGLAVGLGPDCGSAVAVTADGGVSWTLTATPLLDAALVTRRQLWGIAVDASGARVVSRYRLRGATLTPTRQASAVACATADGNPSFVVAATSLQAWQLCQQSLGTSRLLAMTIDGGATWQPTSDTSSGTTGLSGRGGVVALASSVDGTTDTLWAVSTGATRCARGSLLRSDDDGQTFTPLSCPVQQLGLDKVFDVAFTSATDGYLLGSSGSRTVIGETFDGGATWQTSVGSTGQPSTGATP
jgi:hypothetical protein